jgi:hypothetical protein
MGILVLAGLGLAACAPEVVRRPTQITSMEGVGESIEILADLRVAVGPGYDRVISKGSVWSRIGRSGEGEVYKPVNQVFTVEGAHVHEAYLVLDGDRVVGFYLPVERAFSPVPGGSNARLSFQRRSP